jgi:peptidoglycan-N-acetylglucosamine deacetylase
MKYARSILLFILNVCIVSLIFPYATDVYALNSVPEDKKVYLTFDDGPIPGVTEEILNILKEQNVKATFFVVGKEIPDREYILKRIYQEGHTIGLHTYNHKFKKVYRSDNIFVEEMLAVRKKVNEVLNINPTAIRFPGGSSGRMTQELLDKLHSNNMRVYDWTIDLHDGNSAAVNAAHIIKNGAKFNPKHTRHIILGHCNSNNKNTVKALPSIIQYYKDLGFEFAAIKDDTPDYYYRLKGQGSKGTVNKFLR